MEEIVIPICVLLIPTASIAAFIWQLSRVRRGLCSRLKGIVWYAIYSWIPVLLFVGVFFALVGIEELSKTSLIGEGYGRSVMMVGFGGTGLISLGTIVFSIVLVFIKVKAV
jgi:hypothetical protein